MKNASFYIIFMLIFLGLSKSFSPEEQSFYFLKNEQSFSPLFYGSPITVILIDNFRSGFLIKSYYQKYKVVNGFTGDYEVIVKTTKEFWTQNLENLGMSLFHRDERDAVEHNIPTPPGFMFLGDQTYGHWDNHPSGDKVWIFHRAYKNFPKMFLWGEDFLPTYHFYQMGLISLSMNTPYLGNNIEFGTNGKVTSTQIMRGQYEYLETPSIKAYLTTFFSIPQKIIGEQ
jgi:hypothetical protein